jgi:DNA-binding response OmpR family regulator
MTSEQAAAGTGAAVGGGPAGEDRPVILVADDEQDIRELIAYRLSRAGYVVVEACDGAEALRLAAAQPLRAAVLDVMMPGLNGYQVTERLREDPATHRLPVLLMSASVQDSDISRGFEAGADDYLTKPFHPDEMLARVQAVITRR